MKITTVEYKVIRVSDPVGSGDVIAKTSPNSVDEMIIHRKESSRILSIGFRLVVNLRRLRLGGLLSRY